MNLIFEFLRAKTCEPVNVSVVEDTSKTLSRCITSDAVKITTNVKCENLDDSCFYENSLQSNSAEDSSSIHKTNSSFSIDSSSSSSFNEYKSSSVKSIDDRSSSDNDSFFKKEFQYGYPDNSNLVKQELIAELCIEIDTKHQLLNMHISNGVSNCGDLKLNATFWNYVIHNIGLISFLNDSTDDDSGEIFLAKKQEFMKNFYNLLLCLNKLEKYLAIYLGETGGEFSFDAEFFLGLSFLIYEKGTRLTQSGPLNKSHAEEIELVFELDMVTNNCYDDSIWLFELNLNNLLRNCILKFLPDLIDLQKSESAKQFVGSGRSSLEFFKNLFNNEKFNVADTATNFDIDILISKPCLDFQEINPITRSYKGLLNNLNALKFFSHDPFLEADNEAEERGREVNNVSFGCLAFSYLSMGYFEIKMLLENSFHFLYEIREFNEEFRKLFRRDKNENAPQTWMKNFRYSDDYDEYLQFSAQTKTNQTKWNIDLSNRQLKQEKLSSPIIKPICDDIIQRISNLNIPIMLQSKFKLIGDSDYLTQELRKHPSLNSPTEMIGSDNLNSSNNSFSYPSTDQPIISNFQRSTYLNFEHLNSTDVYNDFYENSKSTWPKPDLMPIGTKPASMTNLSYSSMNRNRFNKSSSTVCFNSNLRQTPSKLDLVQNFKIIWNTNPESNSLIKKNEVLKINSVIEPLINKTPPNSINNRKYSVAPSSLMMHTSREKKLNVVSSRNTLETFKPCENYSQVKGIENQNNTTFHTKIRSVMSYGSEKHPHSFQRSNDFNKAFTNTNELILNDKLNTSNKKHTVSNVRHESYSPDVYHYSSRY